jgi:hypothetical protein
MKRSPVQLLAIVAFLFAAAVRSLAAPVYVGSWSVYDPAAPLWNDPAFDPTGPLAYTAQEAAALLFGGVASDYYISTASDQVADINHLAWYDVKGWGGFEFAENYSNKYLGAFYGPTMDFGTAFADSPASAFVQDNFVFDVNYAFRIDTSPVPETGTTAVLLAGGFAAFAVLRRRRTA